MKNSRFTLYRIVIIGLMAAMVFVCTMFLGIRIPTPTGTTQLKTANAICLLTGLLFGGWTGGLAAGIGSALFDLTYPEWAAGAWLTFIFFFASEGERLGRPAQRVDRLLAAGNGRRAYARGAVRRRTDLRSRLPHADQGRERTGRDQQSRSQLRGHRDQRQGQRQRGNSTPESAAM